MKKKVHLAITLLLLVVFIASILIEDVRLITQIFSGFSVEIYAYSYRKKFYLGISE